MAIIHSYKSNMLAATSCALLSILAIPGGILADSTAYYDAGDNLAGSDSARSLRDVDTIAEVTQAGDPRGQLPSGGVQTNYVTLEVAQRHQLPQQYDAQNNPLWVNNIGAIFDSVLEDSSDNSRRYTFNLGLAARSMINEVNDTGSQRSISTGLSSYSGFGDPLGGPATYPLKGLAESMTAGSFYVELDSQNSTSDTTANSVNGVVISISDGLKTHSSWGNTYFPSKVGTVIGLDINLSSKGSPAVMDSYTGIKVQKPKDNTGAYRQDNLTNKSYGIRVEGTHTLAASVTDPDPTGGKYVGLRVEGATELAEKVIYSPNGVVTVTAQSQALPVDRAVLKLSATGTYYMSAPFAAGVDGQQLQVINISNSHIYFQDSGNLNLSGAGGTKDLSQWATLTLVYNSDAGKWLQTGYSAN